MILRKLREILKNSAVLRGNVKTSQHQSAARSGLNLEHSRFIKMLRIDGREFDFRYGRSPGAESSYLSDTTNLTNTLTSGSGKVNTCSPLVPVSGMRVHEPGSRVALFSAV